MKQETRIILSTLGLGMAIAAMLLVLAIAAGQSRLGHAGALTLHEQQLTIPSVCVYVGANPLTSASCE